MGGLFLLRAEFDRLVPVPDRLGMPAQRVKCRRPETMAVPQKLLGVHGPWFNLVDGPEDLDRFVEPRQAVGRLAAGSYQVPEVAVARGQVAAVVGDGGEVGDQLLLDRQPLAVLLLRLNPLPQVGQQKPQVGSGYCQSAAKVGDGGEVGGQLLPKG